MTSHRLIDSVESLDLNQFCVEIKVLTVLGDDELRKGSKTRPPVLDTDPDATVETRIAKTSWAT